MALRTLPGTTDRRVDKLLTLLADNAMIVVSGGKIAREIGVARSTVWRWTQRLRELGVKVKSHPRTGYQIERVPDVLMPNMLRQRLANTPFRKRIYHFFKIDSTNNLALHLGHEGEPHGAVVIAEEQTAGRGRVGRSWHSEKSSGIYLTVLLRPKISPVQAPIMTLVAGLAARDAVAEQTGYQADLRWPNDLLLDGKKFCGILTEMHAEPDHVHFVIVGIGINVNHTRMPEELARIATSLRIESGRSHSRLELLVRLLRCLDSYYNRFLAEGAAPILTRFAEVSSYARGKRVRISTATETYVGTTAGLEPNGLLRVERDDGRMEVVTSGDVAEAS
ncbi:MAG: biotin--[acetyl-CoA-carboxylase] ligase [Acidobacteria bacterium]|nr:MAG: biotin--[acetyl-CoA-carboxylase] ligase [Acidobacteriota bacterium]